MSRTIAIAATLAALAVRSIALAATVKGTSGDDALTGTPTADTIFGKAGDDRIHSRDKDADTLDCDPGEDTVKADAKPRPRGGRAPAGTTPRSRPAARDQPPPAGMTR
jgi:hypothetical protein